MENTMARHSSDARWFRLFDCPNPCADRRDKAATVYVLNDGVHTCLLLCGLLDPAVKACVRVNSDSSRFVVYSGDSTTGTELKVEIDRKNCPKCNGDNTVKDGKKYQRSGIYQIHHCRDCRYKFKGDKLDD